MSGTDEKYRVLYLDADGNEQLTAAMTHDQAQARARQLDSEGYAVASVMTASAAQEYMEYRYAPAYRGVKIPDGLRADGQPRSVYEAWKRGVDAELDGAKPKPADENPPAPDLTMSRDVADFILRAVTGLLRDGYWMFRGYGPDDADGQDYDGDLIRSAADSVGRDQITDSDLLRLLAELDADAKDGGDNR